MKVLAFALLAMFSTVAHVPAADAAGVRACKTASGKCTAGQTRAIRVQAQRRTGSATPARDWFERRMLDN